MTFPFATAVFRCPIAVVWLSYSCPIAVVWLSEKSAKTPVYPSIRLFLMDGVGPSTPATPPQKNQCHSLPISL